MGAVRISPLAADLSFGTQVTGLNRAALTGQELRAELAETFATAGALVFSGIENCTVIALATGLWSAMPILCGAAGSYAQLLAARAGVGIGEAGGSPPAQALVSDIFPARSRSTAMAVLFLFIPIGMEASYLLDGWAAGALGWRGAFVLAGLPGFLPCAALYLRAGRRYAAKQRRNS